MERWLPCLPRSVSFWQSSSFLALPCLVLPYLPFPFFSLPVPSLPFPNIPSPSLPSPPFSFLILPFSPLLSFLSLLDLYEFICRSRQILYIWEHVARITYLSLENIKKRGNLIILAPPRSSKFMLKWHEVSILVTIKQFSIFFFCLI